MECWEKDFVSYNLIKVAQKRGNGEENISFKMLSLSTCSISLELHERFLAFIFYRAVLT